MAKIANKPPVGKPYIWHTRELICSDAWRSLSVNGQRLINFLEAEWMRHSGQKNGSLVAPRHQLEEWGIGARHVSAAISEVARLGLVDCVKGSGRRASRYALTWLPVGEEAATNRWQAHHNPRLGQNLPGSDMEGKDVASVWLPKGYPRGIRREVTTPVAASEGKSLDGKTPSVGVSEGKPPYRESYQGGDESFSMPQREGVAA